MKKIMTTILGSIVAFTLTTSAVFSAATEVKQKYLPPQVVPAKFLLVVLD